MSWGAETTVRVALIELTWQRLDAGIVAGYFEGEERPVLLCILLMRAATWESHRRLDVHDARINVANDNENGARLGCVAR